MRKPAVSCVMAVYNPKERFLQEAIESILSQTYSDFEFIIVDDGSEGKILDVLRSYKDQRLRIFALPHGGLSRALNFGIRQASAPYIARQDADDLSLHHRFEVQISFLEKHPEIHLLGAFSILIDEEGKLLNPIILPVNPHEVRRSLLKANHIIHGSVMIRHSALVEVGVYDERFQIGQDYDLWFRVSERYPIMNIPEILYKMRHYKKSLARGNPNLFQSQIKLVRKNALNRMKKDMEEIDLQKIPIKTSKRRKKIRCMLLNTYIHEFPSIIRDIADAFHELGHKAKLLTLPNLEGLKLRILSGEIKKFKPNFILSINSIHLTPGALNFFSKNEVPVAIWYVGTIDSLEGESGNLIAFVFDKFYMEIAKRRGFRKVFHLPLATNPKVFAKIELKEKIDVAFCGDSFYPFYLNYKTILKKMGLRRDVVDEILRQYARSPIIEVKQLLSMIEERLRFRIHFQSEERESYFLKTLEKAATILYRKSLLSCLSNSELHLYGDYGWMEFDEEKFAGFIDSHEEMARLYNLVKVNLNITETQFKTTLSPSIFNILACKGFALTDYRMDLEEFFDLGKELVCFRDENDLREKIKYYIRNPDEREEIGRRGLEKVLASHTYKNRIERMIKCIEG